MNDSFYKYADLQLVYHSLCDKEQDTSEIEDELSDLWESLSDAQNSSLKGMSSDLNWLRRNGILPPYGRKAADITEEEYQKLLSAIEKGNSHEVLHYLRICSAILSRETLALARGFAYQSINLLKYSNLFLEFHKTILKEEKV